MQQGFLKYPSLIFNDQGVLGIFPEYEAAKVINILNSIRDNVVKVG